MVEGRGILLGRVLAPANRHDSPLLAPTLDKLDDIGPLPDDITVHLDAGYDSQKTRDELAGHDLTGESPTRVTRLRSGRELVPVQLDPVRLLDCVAAVDHD
jgi:IS5 family transposase